MGRFGTTQLGKTEASAQHRRREQIELSSKTYLASLVFLWDEIQMGRA